MSAQVAADLRAAAEVLRRDGWTQEEYHRPCGHCTLGAIGLATGSHINLRPVEDSEGLDFDLPLDYDAAERERKAQRALASALGLGVFVVPDWNDAPGRTADEVIAALEAAADAAEATA